MMLADYKVQFRREETLADTALTWRREALNENYSYFNVIEFVEGVLSKNIKNPFAIDFFDAVEGQKPALVEFNPRRALRVDRAIWHLANIGEPDARFIIAHEIGHLLLHDHFAKGFSDDPADRIKSARPEYSAEWQANVFAFYFLLPDMIVAAYRTIAELSAACSVTETIARQRLSMSSRLALLYSASESGVCSSCGDFTVGGKCNSAACIGQRTQYATTTA
jgi:hypothetical protein